MQIRIFLVISCAALASSTASSQDTGPHAGIDPASFFQTSDRCIACHSNLTTASGADVSIGYNWRASMMANSARDPYWHAAVRREVMDHPSAQAAIEDKCSTCHMPMARFSAAAGGSRGQVFASLAAGGGPALAAGGAGFAAGGGPGAQTTGSAAGGAAAGAVTAAAGLFAMDGVSCTVCHQIEPDNFGAEASFDGGFGIDTGLPAEQRIIYGPHAVDAGRQRLMQSAAQFLPGESLHLGESELCATCHTLFTTSLDAAGEQVGTLAEQVPYLEWLHSDYRSTQSCQDCHMPVLEDDVPISSVLGQPRPGFSQHVFRGGNAFMLSILNKYRGELGVEALPQELEATIRRTREFLANETATLTIDAMRRSGASLIVDLTVASLAGHKLPTAYPSRRAWLHVTARDAEGNILFESGRMRANGSIVGNDNDDSGTAYEPHHRTITSADQVQIYEPILGDATGAVTTGLLTGVQYLKDNRILPLGFDKTTAAHDFAVFGAALTDDDFAAGSDRIRYEMRVGDAAAVDLDIELLYQTIGYRWATNLEAYDAEEPRRFTRYYRESSEGSAVRLARATASHE